MFKFSKIAAVLAIVPVLAAISSPAIAASPGQLAGGDNYLVKNVTQGGAYGNSVNATCNDQVQYSMQLSNTQFGALNDVTLTATLPSAGGVSTATATTHLGGQSGTSDTASVTLTSGANQTLVNGTTVLYDDSGNAIRTLPNTVNTSGVNIGTIEGSTTKFVNFKAKVGCDNPPPPPRSVVCNSLSAQFIGSTNVPAKLRFTAKGTATNTTITGYLFNFGDGGKADGAESVVEHTYTKEGEYRATVQVRSPLGITPVVANCSVEIKVTKDKPPVVVPPTPGIPVTPGSVAPGAPSVIPSTGPEAAFAGLFGTGALGFGVRQWLTSRRRLGDLFNQ